MSSRLKKLRSGSASAERCTFCGGKVRAGKGLRMRTGQLACPRCQEHGGLQQLACGHLSPAGALRINENGDGKTFVCAACATGTRPVRLGRN